MNYAAVIFDLDGTLVDSKAGIRWAMREALRHVRPDLASATFEPKIGPKIREIFTQSFRDLNENDLSLLEKAFRLSYDLEGVLYSTPYEKIDLLLKSFVSRKKMLFIVTNKPHAPTDRLLSHLGWRSHFTMICTPDSQTSRFVSKQEMVAALVDEFELFSMSTVLIGDTEEDLKAAIHNSIDFVHAAYGYGSVTHGIGVTKIRSVVRPADLFQFL